MGDAPQFLFGVAAMATAVWVTYLMYGNVLNDKDDPQGVGIVCAAYTLLVFGMPGFVIAFTALLP